MEETWSNCLDSTSDVRVSIGHYIFVNMKAPIACLIKCLYVVILYHVGTDTRVVFLTTDVFK